jgi:hypothetical protein
MKILFKQISTKCGCGEAINFRIKKPNRFYPSVAKATCQACESRYLITLIPKPEASREFTINTKVIHLTQKAKGALSKSLEQTELTA